MEEIILLYRIKVGLINQTPTINQAPTKRGFDKSNPYRKYGIDESRPYKNIK